MNGLENLLKNGVPSNKWTIARPYISHPIHLPDELDSVFSLKRWWSLPRLVELIWDKHDYSEDWSKQPELENKVWDQLLYFGNNMWCTTSKEWLFDTESEALSFLIDNFLNEQKDYLQSIVDMTETKMVTANKLLTIMSNHE